MDLLTRMKALVITMLLVVVTLIVFMVASKQTMTSKACVPIGMTG